jgi:hypothetical protein
LTQTRSGRNVGTLGSASYWTRHLWREREHHSQTSTLPHDTTGVRSVAEGRGVSLRYSLILSLIPAGLYCITALPTKRGFLRGILNRNLQDWERQPGVTVRYSNPVIHRSAAVVNLSFPRPRRPPHRHLHVVVVVVHRLLHHPFSASTSSSTTAAASLACSPAAPP